MLITSSAWKIASPNNTRQATVVLEDKCDGECDRGDDQQPRRRVEGHLLLERVVLGGDRLDRAPNQECVEQTQPEADAEEDAEEGLPRVTGGRYGESA